MESEHDALLEQASKLAGVAQLELSAERMATLAASLPVLLKQLKELRALNAGTHEPPVITFEDEAHV